MEKFFAAAKSLERFKLSFDMGERFDLYTPSLDVAVCLGNTAWDQLRTLALACLEVDYVGLAKSLARQGALEDLGLRSIFLRMTGRLRIGQRF